MLLLLLLLERPLVEGVSLCGVRLGQVVLQMVQVVSLLLLLLLFHVQVSSQVLAGLGVLRVTLRQVEHPRLVLLLRSAVALRGPNHGAHEGVCGEERASTFWVNPCHDG